MLSRQGVVRGAPLWRANGRVRDNVGLYIGIRMYVIDRRVRVAAEATILPIRDAVRDAILG